MIVLKSVSVVVFCVVEVRGVQIRLLKAVRVVDVIVLTSGSVEVRDGC